MSFPRMSGILLHPTCLPSRGGIGDLGPAAYAFLDFLSASKQGLWQVLPLGAPANGNSPYSSTSAFAGNPLLISLERLVERGWLENHLLDGLAGERGPVEYEAVSHTKLPLLNRAAQNFLERTSEHARSRFQNFCAQNEWWLEDFVLFAALREKYNNVRWDRWPSALARRVPEAVAEARMELADKLALQRVLQFFFYEQWNAIRAYCARLSIHIIGDIAIFVDYDSADVWAHRERFRLNEDLQPQVVSGVPPDVFSATGQRWGNPLYDWDHMRARGFEWWVQRLRWATQNCDYIRLDHFRGFAQLWEIPASDPTAVGGRWVDGPGDELFNRLSAELGGLPFFAEDLGFITADVVALRQRHHIPGMAVLQFAFGDPGAHIYLPQRMTPDHVIYTGTHDNDTTLGWWNTAAPYERQAVESLVGRAEDGVNWALIRLAQSSVASFAVAPLQDVLGLGSEGRVNTPSTTVGNYRWRYNPGDLNPELAEKLARLAEVTDRLPHPVHAPAHEEFVA